MAHAPRYVRTPLGGKIMRVFMVYWTLCDVDNFSDFDNIPVGVFRSPQEVAAATHGAAPANMEDWGEPTKRLRSDRYRAWDFNDNAAVYDCVYTVAEYYI